MLVRIGQPNPVWIELRIQAQNSSAMISVPLPSRRTGLGELDLGNSGVLFVL